VVLGGTDWKCANVYKLETADKDELVAVRSWLDFRYGQSFVRCGSGMLVLCFKSTMRASYSDNKVNKPHVHIASLIHKMHSFRIAGAIMQMHCMKHGA
jgi:hypothetical protein